MKTAKKPTERNRLVVLSVLAAVFSVFFVLLLMSYQIVQGAELNEQTHQMTSSKLPIKAARGDIVDCNGVAFAENKAGFNIVFQYAFLPRSQQNEIIRELVELCEENGVEWYDPLPITRIGTPQFLDEQEKEIATLKKKLELNVYATAENCMYYLLDTFNIEGYDDETARKIAGVRYGMVISDFSINNNQYVFAQDVPIEFILKIKEMSHQFPGVDIVEEDIRSYPNGDLLPHVVGTIGAMYAEEYEETYKELGYKMNSEVGRFGIEKVMEGTLHGVDGVRAVEQNKRGDVISEEVTQAPQSGDKVVLTVDAAFQQKVKEALEEHIEWLRSRPDGKGNTVKAGAIVVLDVKTGGVLAMVNYPSFDINNYFSDYASLLNADDNPLFNRATDGLYRPGSTFKTAVAVGGLEEGIINPNSTINCQHTYYYYDILPNNKFHPTCLGWHGQTDVSKALTVSCNIFFYDVGRRLGIDKMNKYAGLLGLGEETGLEIPSKQGALSGPARSETLGSTWFQGNVVQAAIGQMDTSVTPLQLAIQAMTLANKGTRYKAHIIKEVRSYDDKEVLSSTEPEIASQFEIHPQNYQAIVDGMIGAAEKVGGAYSLSNLGYQVAIKTGSPQVDNNTTNSAVIGFAPVEAPEIAIGVMLEEGENANYLVRRILDAYYSTHGKDSAYGIKDQPAEGSGEENGASSSQEDGDSVPNSGSQPE